MTELDKKIDREVGLDVEAYRTTLLKFVNFGTQKGRESIGVFTEAEVQEKLKAHAESVLSEVVALLDHVAELQSVVEKNYEDDALNNLKVDDNGMVSYKDVMAIVNDVDQRHTAIYKDVQRAGLVKIKEKFSHSIEA